MGSFDGGQKLNPTFWSNDCRTPLSVQIAAHLNRRPPPAVGFCPFDIPTPTSGKRLLLEIALEIACSSSPNSARGNAPHQTRAAAVRCGACVPGPRRGGQLGGQAMAAMAAGGVGHARGRTLRRLPFERSS